MAEVVEDEDLNHAQVCFEQIKHPSFKEMDKDGQDNVFLYLVSFLNDYWIRERESVEINRVVGLYNNYFNDNYGRQIYYTQGVFKIKNI